MRLCRSPLPPLFMRFVIQSFTNAPQLRGFVCDILATLVNKAVWANPQQWKGWVVCVSNLVPDSLPVLLQVKAPPQLVSALFLRGMSSASASPHVIAPILGKEGRWRKCRMPCSVEP